MDNRNIKKIMVLEKYIKSLFQDMEKVCVKTPIYRTRWGGNIFIGRLDTYSNNREQYLTRELPTAFYSLSKIATKMVHPLASSILECQRLTFQRSSNSTRIFYLLSGTSLELLNSNVSILLIKLHNITERVLIKKITLIFKIAQ